jgi:hypothetical protein
MFFIKDCVDGVIMIKKVLSLFLCVSFFFVTSGIAQAVNDIDDVSNRINIVQSQIPLSSKLKKDYNAYRYDIQNNSNQDINIVNAQIINGTNGSIAVQSVNGGHPIGTTWAICGPVGLFTLGIGWAVGLLATPVVWGISSSNDNKARKESIAYSNLVNFGYLKKGDSTSVQTLVPIGAQPQIKLTVQAEGFKDLIMVGR